MSHSKILLITTTLFIVITIIFYAILYPLSPRSVKADIYTLRFLGTGWENRYQIQGNQMTCQQVEDYPSTTCTTTFEGKPLAIDVVYTDDTRHLAAYCRVVYGEQPVTCEPTINYENVAPTLVIRDSLGTTPERFQELRAETPLLYISENQWVVLAQGIALFLMLVIMVWRWWHYASLSSEPAEEATRVFLSGIIGFFTLLALGWGLGTFIGFRSEIDSGVYWTILPIAGVIGAGLAIVGEWKLSGGWKPETAVFRFIYSFGGGIVFFGLLNLSFMFSLLWLGFSD